MVWDVKCLLIKFHFVNADNNLVIQLEIEKTIEYLCRLIQNHLIQYYDKKISVLFFMFLFSLSASAQIVKMSGGVKGVGMVNQMDIGLNTYGGGGSVFAEVRIANVVGIQAEAVYAMSYGSQEYSISGRQFVVDMEHSYLYVPVVAQIWCGHSFALEAGYQQAIVLDGTLKVFNAEREDTGVFDYGSIVAGIRLNLGEVVTMNLRYAYGLDYSYIATTQPAKNSSFQFGLGFRMFTTRKTIFR